MALKLECHPAAISSLDKFLSCNEIKKKKEREKNKIRLISGLSGESFKLFFLMFLGVACMFTMWVFLSVW